MLWIGVSLFIFAAVLLAALVYCSQNKSLPCAAHEMAEEDIDSVEQLNKDLRVRMKNGDIFYGINICHRDNPLFRSWYYPNRQPVCDPSFERKLSVAAHVFMASQWGRIAKEDGANRIARYEVERTGRAQLPV